MQTVILKLTFKFDECHIKSNIKTNICVWWLLFMFVCMLFIFICMNLNNNRVTKVMTTTREGNNDKNKGEVNK